MEIVAYLEFVASIGRRDAVLAATLEGTGRQVASSRKELIVSSEQGA